MLSRLFNLPVPTNTVVDELNKLVQTLNARGIQTNTHNNTVVCDNTVALRIIDLKDESEFFGNVTLDKRKSFESPLLTFNVFSDELLRSRALVEEKLLYQFKKIPTIGARQCSVVSVPFDDAVTFFNRCHIHNTILDFKSNLYTHGLEHQGKLVQVILFQVRDNDLWMHLIATDGVAVAGGLTKLMSYAVQELGISGKVYTRSRNHISPAPYFDAFFTSSDNGYLYWVTDYAVKVRSDEFFKHPNIVALYEKSGLPELEFIKKLKLDIVWDFGNLLWETESINF